jgi:hypothetical protein
VQQEPGSITNFSDNDLEDDEEEEPNIHAMKQAMMNTVIMLELMPRLIALQGEEY